MSRVHYILVIYPLSIVKNEFQTKWLEIINPKTSNILVAAIYGHPKKKSDTKFSEYSQTTHAQLFICASYRYS